MVVELVAVVEKLVATFVSVVAVELVAVFASEAIAIAIAIAG